MLRNRLRQQPGIRMILAQPRRHLFQRDQPRRRQHTRLPHPSAQRLANTRARSICSAVPTSIDPTGAPSPFDRQNITVSNPLVNSAHQSPAPPPH